MCVLPNRLAYLDIVEETDHVLFWLSAVHIPDYRMLDLPQFRRILLPLLQPSLYSQQDSLHRKMNRSCFSDLQIHDAFFSVLHTMDCYKWHSHHHTSIRKWCISLLLLFCEKQARFFLRQIPICFNHCTMADPRGQLTNFQKGRKHFLTKCLPRGSFFVKEGKTPRRVLPPRRAGNTAGA